MNNESNERTDRQMYRWIDGSTEERTDRWMDGWMDG